MGIRTCASLLSMSCVLAGCAALVQPSQPKPVIQVAIINKVASVTGTAPIIIDAIVNNDRGKNGVLWLLESNGVACSPACGTLSPIGSPSFSATYMPPSTLPPGTSIQVTIVAKSVSNSSKEDQFTITVSANPLSISLSGTFQSVVVAGPVNTISATTNDPAGLTWSLTAGGVPCSPNCGTLLFSGGQHLVAWYTPPPIFASGTSPSATITATSITSPAQSSSFSFNFIVPPTSNYSLLLRGYDASGRPLAIAGVLVADSAGNIKGGELDINDGGTATQIQSLQGSFGTDTNFAGIIRGTISITNAFFPGTSVKPVFKFVIRGTQLEARVIEFDGTGNLVAGVEFLQSGLSGQVPTGAFAYGLDSDAPIGSRTVEVGSFDIATGGGIVGISDRSRAQAAVAEQAQSVSGTASGPDALGRGTLQLSFGGETIQYAYYQVSPGELYLIQIAGGSSSSTVLAGVAQERSFDFDSINGVYSTSVFQMTGLDRRASTNALAPDVVIGRMTIAKDNTVSIACDSNDAGAVSVGAALSGTLTSYDPNTGRGVLQVSGGFDRGFADTVVFYLYDNGQGFSMSIDPTVAGGTTNKGLSGTLIQQILGPFNMQSINGTMIGVSGASSVLDIPALEAAVSADGSSGHLIGLAYANSVQGLITNVTFGETFSITDPNTGHGTATVPAGFYGDFTQGAVDPATFYLIGPNRFVSIGTKDQSISGITYFSPD